MGQFSSRFDEGFLKDRVTCRREQSFIIVSGDFAFCGELIEQSIRLGLGWTHPLKSVFDELKKAHILFRNLEGPFSTDGTPVDKWIRLHQSENSIRFLTELGFDVVSLANNHITDYGSEAVKRTTEILDANGIPWFGVGLNRSDIRKSVVIEKNGLRIGILGYADPGEKAVIAGESSSGCFPIDPERIADDINDIRGLVDFLCISLHWGKEFYRYPSPSQISTARRPIDHGADIIIGHHAHVYQGVERYGGA